MKLVIGEWLSMFLHTHKLLAWEKAFIRLEYKELIQSEKN